MAQFEVRVFGISKEGAAILMNDEDGIMFFDKLTRLLHTNLADGAQLETAKDEIITHLVSILDRLGTRVKLLEWLTYQMAIGTCRAIWGPANPISSREMVNAFL